jgi:hypothetical protein
MIPHVHAPEVREAIGGLSEIEAVAADGARPDTAYEVVVCRYDPVPVMRQSISRG